MREVTDNLLQGPNPVAVQLRACNGPMGGRLGRPRESCDWPGILPITAAVTGTPSSSQMKFIGRNLDWITPRRRPRPYAVSLLPTVSDCRMLPSSFSFSSSFSSFFFSLLMATSYPSLSLFLSCFFLALYFPLFCLLFISLFLSFLSACPIGRASLYCCYHFPSPPLTLTPAHIISSPSTVLLFRDVSFSWRIAIFTWYIKYILIKSLRTSLTTPDDYVCDKLLRQ